MKKVVIIFGLFLCFVVWCGCGGINFFLDDSDSTGGGGRIGGGVGGGTWNNFLDNIYSIQPGSVSFQNGIMNINLLSDSNIPSSNISISRLVSGMPQSNDIFILAAQIKESCCSERSCSASNYLINETGSTYTIQYQGSTIMTYKDASCNACTDAARCVPEAIGGNIAFSMILAGVTEGEQFLISSNVFRPYSDDDDPTAIIQTDFINTPQFIIYANSGIPSPSRTVFGLKSLTPQFPTATNNGVTTVNVPSGTDIVLMCMDDNPLGHAPLYAQIADVMYDCCNSAVCADPLVIMEKPTLYYFNGGIICVKNAKCAACTNKDGCVPQWSSPVDINLNNIMGTIEGGRWVFYTGQWRDDEGAALTEASGIGDQFVIPPSFPYARYTASSSVFAGHKTKVEDINNDGFTDFLACSLERCYIFLGNSDVRPDYFLDTLPAGDVIEGDALHDVAFIDAGDDGCKDLVYIAQIPPAEAEWFNALLFYEDAACGNLYRHDPDKIFYRNADFGGAASSKNFGKSLATVNTPDGEFLIFGAPEEPNDDSNTGAIFSLPVSFIEGAMSGSTEVSYDYMIATGASVGCEMGLKMVSGANEGEFVAMTCKGAAAYEFSVFQYDGSSFSVIQSFEVPLLNVPDPAGGYFSLTTAPDRGELAIIVGDNGYNQAKLYLYYSSGAQYRLIKELSLGDGSEAVDSYFGKDGIAMGMLKGNGGGDTRAILIGAHKGDSDTTADERVSVFADFGAVGENDPLMMNVGTIFSPVGSHINFGEGVRLFDNNRKLAVGAPAFASIPVVSRGEIWIFDVEASEESMSQDYWTDPDGRARSCGVAGVGSCYIVRERPACNVYDVCNSVCDEIPYCCNTKWDDRCVAKAVEIREAQEEEVPECFSDMDNYSNYLAADSYDPMDDTIDGATEIVPKATVQCSDVRSSLFDQTQDIDFFRVNLNGGTTYYFDAFGSGHMGGKAVVDIYSGDDLNTALSSNRDAGTGFIGNSCIEYTPDRAGTYYVKIYGNETNVAYSLKYASGPGYCTIADIPILLFAKAFGVSEEDVGRDIYQTADEGYIASGYRSSPTIVPYITKFSKYGQVEWENTYSSVYLPRLRPISDGYIMCSTFSADFELVKLNASGDVLWAKRYGTTAQESLGACMPAADGGYLLGGSTKYYSSAGDDGMLMKVDGNGNHLWTRIYSSYYYGNYNDVINSLGVLSNGTIVAGGYTYTPSWVSYGADAWIMRLNSTGGIISQNAYGLSSQTEWVWSDTILPTSDGGFVVVVYSWYNSYKTWVMKFNSSGAIQWSKLYNANPGSISMTSDGGFLINVAVTSGAGFLKIASNGEVSFIKAYYDPDAGSATGVSINAVKQTFDGGYVGWGSTYNFGLADRDRWLLRMDADGKIGDCAVTREGVTIEPAYAANPTIKTTSVLYTSAPPITTNAVSVVTSSTTPTVHTQCPEENPSCLRVCKEDECADAENLDACVADCAETRCDMSCVDGCMYLYGGDSLNSCAYMYCGNGNTACEEKISEHLCNGDWNCTADYAGRFCTAQCADECYSYFYGNDAELLWCQTQLCNSSYNCFYLLYYNVCGGDWECLFEKRGLCDAQNLSCEQTCEAASDGASYVYDSCMDNLAYYGYEEYCSSCSCYDYWNNYCNDEFGYDEDAYKACAVDKWNTECNGASVGDVCGCWCESDQYCIDDCVAYYGPM